MRRLRNLPVRLVPVLAGALTALALLAGGALAYFETIGSGLGSALTSSLLAPSITQASDEGTNVTLSWSAVKAPGSGAVEYYLTRDGGVPAGNCPTSSTPTTATSCTDTGLSIGSHTFTVVAVWRSWSAASAAAEVHVVKQSQTIKFTSTGPTGARVGESSYAVTATASSGLPVTLSVDATAKTVCTLSGSSSGSTVTLIGVGTCVIDANQAGSTSFEPAPQLQQSFAVAKGAQTIKFTSTPSEESLVGGGTYTVTATSSSSLAVTLSVASASASVCSLSGSASGSTVSFLSAGTCAINANQSGNGNYEPATQVQQSFTVGRKLAITGDAKAGKSSNYTFKGEGFPGREVSVEVCKINQFPCPAKELVGTGTAVVSSGGEWTSGGIGPLSSGVGYFARATQAKTSTPSAVLSFTA